MLDIYDYPNAKLVGMRKLADAAKLAFEASRADTRVNVFGATASMLTLVAVSNVRTNKTAGAVGLLSAAAASVLMLRQRRLALDLNQQARMAADDGVLQLWWPEMGRSSELASLNSEPNVPHGPSQSRQ